MRFLRRKIMKRTNSVILFAILAAFCITAAAQATEFTYQGQMTTSGSPATGNHDFEFALFDAVSGGTQVGSTIGLTGIAVTNGIFSAKLDFGNQFPGAGRFLEIRVRPTGSGTFTTLTPRQAINSAPYSVKSLNSNTADTANTATTAANISNPLAGDVTGIQSNTSVVRLRGRTVASTLPNNGQVLKFNATNSQWEPANDETATPGSGGTITGVTAGTGLTGGGTTGSVTLAIAPGGVNTAQLADGSVTDAKVVAVNASKVAGTLANASIPGANVTGIVPAATNAVNAVNFAGTLSGDVTGTQAATAIANGAVTTTKISNLSVTDAKIVGVAGSKISGSIATATIPGANVVGAVDSATNATTAANFSGSLVGDVTGTQGATVIAPSAVTNAKIANNAVTAAKIASSEVVKSINNLKDNVTLAAGTNITITPVGSTLTIASTGGGGIQNQTTLQTGANFNIDGTGTAIVFNAGTQFNLNGSRILSRPGSFNLFAGEAAGAANSGTSNSFFGSRAGASNTGGSNNSFFGSNSGENNLTGERNSYFGASTGSTSTTASQNSFFGNNVGESNLGSQNSFFGSFAGETNGLAGNNSFFGANAGRFNVSGSDNSFFGAFAGDSNTTGFSNAFFGRSAGSGNTTGGDNAFFGLAAGQSNSVGSSNSFFGRDAGIDNTTGFNNAYFGKNSGGSNVSGSSNTMIGTNADVLAGNLTNATAIGARAAVSQDNSIVLGSISGVNGASSTASVGINTTAPKTRLHVVGNLFIENNPNSLIIQSPNGSCFKISVSNAGVLSAVAQACP